MEDLNQDYGFVLYRKTFPNGLKGKLELKTAQDYTVVMVNGKTVGTSFVGDGLDSNKIELPQTAGPATLDLLVYNLGRISVVVSAETAHLARKGLIGGATLDGKDLSGWQIYSLPYHNVNNFKASAAAHDRPDILSRHIHAGQTWRHISRHEKLEHGRGLGQRPQPRTVLGSRRPALAVLARPMAQARTK